jgi:hypothetical protein
MAVIFPPVSARRTSKPPSNPHRQRAEIERQRRAEFARRNVAIINHLKGCYK